MLLSNIKKKYPEVIVYNYEDEKQKKLQNQKITYQRFKINSNFTNSKKNPKIQNFNKKNKIPFVKLNSVYKIENPAKLIKIYQKIKQKFENGKEIILYNNYNKLELLDLVVGKGKNNNDLDFREKFLKKHKDLNMKDFYEILKQNESLF